MPDEQHRIGNGELSRLVYKHDASLYGNGKPGVMERLALMENIVEAIKFYARWILVTVLGILVVAIVHLVVVK